MSVITSFWFMPLTVKLEPGATPAKYYEDAIGEIVNQIAKMQYMSAGRLKMPVLLRGCIGIGHAAATHQSGNY